MKRKIAQIGRFRLYKLDALGYVLIVVGGWWKNPLTGDRYRKIVCSFHKNNWKRFPIKVSKLARNWI